MHSEVAINTALTLTGIWVAVNYLLLGMVVFPTLRLSWWAAGSAGLFFVFCALTHVLLAFAAHSEFIGHTRAELYLLFHILQGIGGSVFIAMIRRGWVIIKLSDDF